jgi:hypothetical protein
MTPEDVIFKLGQLLPSEIARLMQDSGVKALRTCSSACAVTQYVYDETKMVGIRTGYDSLYYGPELQAVELPSSVQTFISLFDDGFFPELDAEHPMNQE